MNDQLYEVWGLEKEVVEKVLENFQVIEAPSIQKINVNTASFKEVLSIAYIDYELTKMIFNYQFPSIINQITKILYYNRYKSLKL